jgi:carotenoid cleavage dioxygenase-like enzyme
MASDVAAAVRGAVMKGMVAVSERNRKALPEPKSHPFLTGPQAPLDHEAEFLDLDVSGELPAGLDGLYARNGPNPLPGTHAPSHHWFIGEAMVHGVRLRDGKALWYRARYVRSSGVSAHLGEPPAPGQRDPRTDIANTHVIGIGGRIFALVEAGAHPVELDGELGTLAHNPFDGTLAGSYSAHPHLDPDTGELHAICYSAVEPDVSRHVVLGPDARVVRDLPFACPGGPSIHDCALTRHHVLVFDLPVTRSMKAFLAGWRFPYRWNPAHRARVGLLPRAGGAQDIVWCPVDPCYVFHVANAHEDGAGRVIADLVVHDSMFERSGYGPDSRRITFERWTIDPRARRVARTVLDDRPQEFPRVDERRSTRPHRHAWTTELHLGDPFTLGRALIRHDAEKGSIERHDFGPGAVAGEFVFVPRAGSSAEDDGWLMGYVTFPAEDRSELVVLDAGDFGGPAVARVHIPQRIPTGFHGSWIPAA